MQNHKSKGEKLHNDLKECLAKNDFGEPYEACSRICKESEFWVNDGKKECFSPKKHHSAFKVEQINESHGKDQKICWLVCVDEGIITNLKSSKTRGYSIPRCDNFLFDDNIFYYVEAKMGVKDKRWEEEFQDSIKNKIPETKSFLLSKLNDFGYSISQKIGIAITYSGSNWRIPRTDIQKQESLRT